MDGWNGRKAKEWRSDTWKEKEEIEEGRKDGEKKRTRGEESKKEGRKDGEKRTRGELEMAEMERKRNRLGEKLVGANNNQPDRIDSTYTLICIIGKSERQEKGGKEGEMHRHCSHWTIRLSMTTMMNLPCNNQPSCDSNVSMG